MSQNLAFSGQGQMSFNSLATQPFPTEHPSQDAPNMNGLGQATFGSGYPMAQRSVASAARVGRPVTVPNGYVFGAGPGQQSLAPSRGSFGEPNDPLMNELGMNSSLTNGKMAYMLRPDNEPWNPLGMGSAPRREDMERAGRIMNQSMFNMPPFAYNSYRDVAGPPSEADATTLPDSGYRSMAPAFSHGAPSVRSETDNAETRSIISHFQQTLQFSKAQEKRKRATPRVLGASESPLICAECKAPVKTNSELKKHQQRHNRPYLCDVPECGRSAIGEGFSTQNDLDRHKRTVHKSNGQYSGRIYHCRLEPCKSNSPPKDWPRLDNFRQHLKRVHNYIHDSEDMSSFAVDNNPEQDDGASYTSYNPSNVRSHRGGGGDDIDLAGLGAGPAGQAWPHGQGQPDNQFFDEASPELDMTTSLSRSRYPGVLTGTGGANYIHPDSLMSSIQPLAAPFMAQQIAELDQHVSLDVDVTVDDPPRPAQEEPVFQDQQDDVSGATDPLPKPGGMSPVMPNECVPDHSVSDHDMPEHDAVDHGLSYHDVSDDDDDEPFDAAADHEPASNAPDEDSMSPSAPTPRSPDPDHLQLKQADSPPLSKPAPADTDFDIYDTAKMSALIEQLEANGLLSGLVLPHGYQRSEPDTQVAEPADGAVAQGKYVCSEPNCSKTYKLQSQLKKHMKRHRRPYGCTFQGCGKSFGSKNDWKRHETSQHSQPELWRCPETAKDVAGVDCGKVYLQRESLKSHLEHEHSIKKTVLDEKLTSGRLDPNFENRFWCGFCCRTMTTQSSASEKHPAHTFRFDHLDEHFNAKGRPEQDISQYRYLVVEEDGGTAVSRQVNPKKRPLDGESSNSRSRRPRPNSNDTKWSCCDCGQYWDLSMNQCLEDACVHYKCENCPLFDMPQHEEPIT